VYVYRDTGDQPGGPAATGQGPGGNDAAYWYDLPGSAAGPGEPPPGEEARGPFEPLVSSSDPPGADQAPADPAAGDAPAEPAYERARKLEQIKDLYLTAEAIGEANVDKHFDRLLAQQRELISEYFRQPGSAGLEATGGPAPEPGAGADSPHAGPAASADIPYASPADVADQAGTEPGAPRVPGPPPSPAGPSEGARVTADRPHAW
jgi:hypothetical protein